MGKRIKNVKFRVHNFEHAKLIHHRIQQLNTEYIGEDWEPLIQPPYKTPYLWVDDKGIIYWGKIEAMYSFEKLDAREMILEELYEIPNKKRFNLNFSKEDAFVNIDDQRVEMGGVKISFSELNRLNNLLNDSK